MRIPNCRELFDTSHTIAAGIFNDADMPWEVLPKIHDFIMKFGETLDADVFYSPSPGVWLAKSASIEVSALIKPPCIIDEGAEIRHCAFIRGNAVIGKNAVIGNSCEVKNAIIFDNAQIPHFNYCGDSVVGYRAHLSAGVITSNVKSDKTNVTVSYGDGKAETGLRKFGAMIGDFVEVGCNTVLNPGTVIGRRTSVYPLSRVRGVIDADTIYKDERNIVKKY